MRERVRIAILPGDGVGPELIGHAVRVLDVLSSLEEFEVDLVEFPHSAAHYHRTGELFGDEAYEVLSACDCLLFGAAGDPSLPPGLMERALILELAQRLGCTIGVRPAFLHAAALTPLKGLDRGDIDLTIVRDTTEGELVLPGGTLHPGTAGETSASVMIHTRYAVDRTVTHAFRLARRKVTLVAQSNVLAPHQLWERRFDALAAEYPQIEHEVLYPDNAVAQLVSAPQQFDVIVTTLFLGGVLSDLVGALVGGIGLIGSSRLNAETGFGMYEPSHGSAPKYAGLDRVSPMATFNALAMLLEDRGQRGAAGRLRGAIDSVLRGGEAGLSTRSGVGTTAATDFVIARLQSNLL